MFQYRQPKLLILDPALVVDIYVKYFKHFGDNTFCDAVNFKFNQSFHCPLNESDVIYFDD